MGRRRRRRDGRLVSLQVASRHRSERWMAGANPRHILPPSGGLFFKKETASMRAVD
jgi:hypothetical protein